ncbi:MAG: hypothetical protein QW607_05830 [Desulfurococcaceae archaeon]
MKQDMKTFRYDKILLEKVREKEDVAEGVMDVIKHIIANAERGSVFRLGYGGVLDKDDYVLKLRVVELETFENSENENALAIKKVVEDVTKKSATVKNRLIRFDVTIRDLVPLGTIEANRIDVVSEGFDIRKIKEVEKMSKKIAKKVPHAYVYVRVKRHRWMYSYIDVRLPVPNEDIYQLSQILDYKNVDMIKIDKR